MIWTNLFHIYQPADWEPRIIVKVATESYRPLLDILKRNASIRITLNISATLTEQLVKYDLTDILDDVAMLAARGQVEFTGSAKYHTILPLLSESEIERQIKLNTEVNRRYLGGGYKPTGFFPPEMCYSYKMAEVVKSLGFKWIMLDEICYDGTIGSVSLDRGYLLTNGLQVVFRNRQLSDYLAFSATIDQPESVARTLRADVRSQRFLITAMDGENVGHHRVGTDRLWEAIITRFETITVSQLLQRYDDWQSLNPLPGSWSSQPDDLRHGAPYVLWHDHTNEIHMLQWTLTHHITNLVTEAEKQGDPQAATAHQKLDAALASDQFWWASAEPWWSREIVLRETGELVAVVTDLTSVSAGDRRHADELYAMIVRETERWNKEGIAKKRAVAFQKRTRAPRYLGGKRVT